MTTEWCRNLGMLDYIITEQLERIMFHFDMGKNVRSIGPSIKFFLRLNYFLCDNSGAL